MANREFGACGGIRQSVSGAMGFDAAGAGSRISFVAGAARRRRAIESGLRRTVGKFAAAAQGGIVERQIDVRFAQGGRRSPGRHGFRRFADRKDAVRKSERIERHDLGMVRRASAVPGEKNRSEMGQACRVVEWKRFEWLENEREREV